MAPQEEVDYILADCFFAAGQTVGSSRQLDYDALVWWRSRYRDKFLHAMLAAGNSWERDRRRVTAVGRYLGQRVVEHAGIEPVISLESAAKASFDVESGCRMNAERDALLPAPAGG